MDIDNIGPVYLGGMAITIETASAELTMRGLLGFTNMMEAKIQVRTEGVAGQAVAQTLTHELLHAVDHVFCLGDELSEAQVTALSQGLYQLIVDNPGIIAAIQAEGEMAAGACCHDGDDVAKCTCYDALPGGCDCGYKSDDTQAK